MADTTKEEMTPEEKQARDKARMAARKRGNILINPGRVQIVDVKTLNAESTKEKGALAVTLKSRVNPSDEVEVLKFGKKDELAQYAKNVMGKDGQPKENASFDYLLDYRPFHYNEKSSHAGETVMRGTISNLARSKAYNMPSAGDGYVGAEIEGLFKLIRDKETGEPKRFSDGSLMCKVNIADQTGAIHDDANNKDTCGTIFIPIKEEMLNDPDPKHNKGMKEVFEFLKTKTKNDKWPNGTYAHICCTMDAALVRPRPEDPAKQEGYDKMMAARQEYGIKTRNNFTVREVISMWQIDKDGLRHGQKQEEQETEQASKKRQKHKGSAKPEVPAGPTA